MKIKNKIKITKINLKKYNTNLVVINYKNLRLNDLGHAFFNFFFGGGSCPANMKSVTVIVLEILTFNNVFQAFRQR